MSRDNIKKTLKFTKEELIADMPLYSIFMVLNDGWYVANKITRKVRRFCFEDYYSYLDVLNYADSIC